MTYKDWSNRIRLRIACSQGTLQTGHVGQPARKNTKPEGYSRCVMISFFSSHITKIETSCREQEGGGMGAAFHVFVVCYWKIIVILQCCHSSSDFSCSLKSYIAIFISAVAVNLLQSLLTDFSGEILSITPAKDSETFWDFPWIHLLHASCSLLWQNSYLNSTKHQAGC